MMDSVSNADNTNWKKTRMAILIATILMCSDHDLNYMDYNLGLIETENSSGGPKVLTTGDFCGALCQIKNDSVQFKTMTWKKKNMQVM